MRAMRRRLGWILVSSAFAVCTGPMLQSVASAGTETYLFDPVHSSATFKVRHFFTQVVGRFDELEGTALWDEAEPTRSSVKLTIQVASINTSNEKRDAHLRSADFFDAETYPTMTFESTKIEEASEAGHYNVHGNLTMRGVTKPIVVDLEVLGFMETPMGRRGGFLAKCRIDRQDFGVSWNRTMDNGGVLLSDDVQVEFPIEVVKETSS